MQPDSAEITMVGGRIRGPDTTRLIRARLSQDRSPPARPQGQGHRRSRRSLGRPRLHQGVSAGHRRRARAHGGGCRRQPIPRLHGRASRSVPPATTTRRGPGGPGRGRTVPPHLRLGLLLRVDGRPLRAAGPHRAGPVAEAGVPHQFRHRGHRRGDQAGPLRHPAHRDHRVPRARSTAAAPGR